MPSVSLHDNIDPRILHTRSVVIAAAGELLAEEDFGAITVESLAARSGVAKSTIYRNWDSRAALLVDAFSHLYEPSEPASTGSLEEDLTASGQDTVKALTQSKWGDSLASVVGAAKHDQSFRDAQQRFARTQKESVATILSQALDRGEIGEGHFEAIAEQFTSPFFYRLLISGDPLDDELVERQVASTLKLLDR